MHLWEMHGFIHHYTNYGHIVAEFSLKNLHFPLVRQIDLCYNNANLRKNPEGGKNNEDFAHCLVHGGA